MISLQAFIDGEYVSHKQNKTIQVMNPATNEVIGVVPSLDKADVDHAVSSAVTAFSKWKKTPAIERARLVKQLLRLMQDESNMSAIGKMITLEMGKSYSSAKSEVFYAADLGEYQTEWARRIEGDVVESDNPNEKILSIREPLGAIGIIVPWNFPIYVLIRKMVPALIAGNTVVIKPSIKSPLSALELAKLIADTDIPKGVINIVTGEDSIVGEALTSSEKISMITFTGSTAVGKRIMEKCAQNMIKVSLELGGKAPAVVMEDADIDLAVQAIAGGRLANSGQVCNNTERLYVQKSIKEAFINRLVEEFSKTEFGDGLENPEIGMTCLVSSNDAKRVHGMVEEAVSEGAAVLCGGELVSEGSSFYPPTILDNCTQDMKIVREEIFGPVLPIVEFETLEEVIEYVNDSDYGLTSNVYSNNYRYIMELISNIECGEVYVNRQQGEAYQGYHSGWKKSGIGGDDGKHGFYEFTQVKTVYMKY
ncbi:aldehyde dehydrogenase [Sporosarcina luteola]|uniref:aldehyde dehydrogenase n=1 Tax=Sporosarcina luteola TaxID=582850 RepID=UPI00203EE6FD|nr:aldehyde dehydrogenase [Sporosarcina luteola]MCM3636572.1 aldehyde dehydrogenase [Sporosarcina luteola]